MKITVSRKTPTKEVLRNIYEALIHIINANATAGGADKINDREVYMKGIDNSYLYEGYLLFKIDEL